MSETPTARMDQKPCPRIWLLGGNGAVGRNLALQFAGQTSNVIVVSRTSNRQLAALDYVATRALDLSDREAQLDMHPGDRIINLTEATAPGLAEQAIRAGAMFIETSASPDYIRAQRAVANATVGKGLLVDCVGVAPGLTNLMADALFRQTADIEKVEIGIEIGLGKHAGFSATAWTISSMGRSYRAKRNHRWVELVPGQLQARFRFGGDTNTRRAIGFPFADQEILAWSPPDSVATILTYLAIDPPFATAIFGRAMRLGLGKFMARRSHSVARALLRLPEYGRAATRITVNAWTASDDNSVCLRLSTGDQSAATAAVIAAVATQDMARLRNTGPAVSITDVLSLEEAIQSVAAIYPETDLRGGSDCDTYRPSQASEERCTPQIQMDAQL